MDRHTNGPVTGTEPVILPNSTPVGGSPADNTTTHAGIIFASAARIAATYNSQPYFNPNARGIRFFTVVANGSGTVTLKVQVADPNTGAWIDLAGAATAALNNSTGALLTIYPGLTGIADSAGVTVNQHLGAKWRAVATVATATETFSVGAEYLL